MPKQPRVEIEYCTQCRWLLRAAWMAQELLTTFASDLGEVALQPGRGGVFEVRVDGETIWSRAAQGRFPEAKELKQRVRDCVAPGRSLGHADSPVRSWEIPHAIMFALTSTSGGHYGATRSSRLDV
jgi:selenoprotein W-related protein